MEDNEDANYNRYDIDDEKNDNKRSSLVATAMPSLLLIHGCLIIAQTLFGGGAIIGQLGLPSTNPVLFALIREGIGGPMLCIIAYFKDKRIPLLSDWKLFIGPGICLFLNQFCFIVGIKISSGITGSAWQPSQGILAVIYGFCFGIEREFDKFKVCGILIGTSSALFMILYNNHDDTNASVWETFGGSIMFFINCSATVMYLILGKPLFKKYPSSTITGYSYMVASLSMVVAAIIVANIPSLLNGVCPDCNGHAWNVPTVTIYALIYWILAESVAAYLLITWANKYADPSVNLAYTVLQPLTSVLSAEILLIFSIVPKCDPNKSSDDNPSNCLYGVSWNDLGALGIAIGLYFVIYSSRLQQKKRQEELERVQNTGIQNLIDVNDSSVIPAPAT